MKLYKLTQTKRTAYDTYDSAIVCAENEEDAQLILPSTACKWDEGCLGSWADKPEQVKVKEIGKANKNQKKGVILASFNAG